jgi:hydrogenase/urease accessory protein HupE
MRGVTSWMAALLGGMLATTLALPVAAHDARPAYLQIDETAAGRYDVTWRTPLFSGQRLPVTLRFPETARNATEPVTRELPDSIVERRLLNVDGGLSGKRIDFVGLQGTITDVLVRVQSLDGLRSITLVRASRPWIEIEPARSAGGIALAYAEHGVEHILLGYDHLLFVLALMLIVRSVRVLFWTITAFTAAHSITLALATLGVVTVPGPPVEAAIALSIMLLAVEILRARRGEPSITARWPWLVAFMFGLLHGLGFAGALTEIGLPRQDVPLALLAFNVGVELGQIAFVAAILAVWESLRRFRWSDPFRSQAVVVSTYGIGVMAAFWFVDRLAGFAS